MGDLVTFARRQAEVCLEQERKNALAYRGIAYLGNPSLALQWLQVAELLAAQPLPGGSPNGKE